MPQVSRPSFYPSRSARLPTWLRITTFLWAVSLPMTSAFSLHGWAPLCLVTPAVIALIYWPQDIDALWGNIGIRDVLLIGIIFLGLLAWAWAPAFGARSRNHGLAITACVLVYYFLQRNLLLKRVGLDEFCRYLSVSLLIASAFIMLEFYLANFTGKLMRDFVPYLEIRMGEEEIYESIMIGGWVRPRGLAVEAGHMVTFYEFALPLSFIHTRHWSGIRRTSFYIFCGLPFLLLASAAGVFSLFVATLVIFFRSGVSARTKWQAFAIGCLLIGATFSSAQSREYAWDIVFNKVFGYVGLTATEGYSAQDRSDRALVAIKIAKQHPLGIGWGTSALMSVESGGQSDIPFGFVSFYAEVLVAAGWPGLLVWIVFIVSTIRLAWNRKDVRMTCALIATLSISIHYITISNFWFPVMWLSYAIIDYLHRQSLPNIAVFTGPRLQRAGQ